MVSHNGANSTESKTFRRVRQMATLMLSNLEMSYTFDEKLMVYCHRERRTPLPLQPAQPQTNNIGGIVHNDSDIKQKITNRCGVLTA